MVREEESEEEEEEENIWSWGAGTEGQLATGKPEDQHLPQQLRRLRRRCFPPIPFSSSSVLPSSSSILRMACGGAHAIALLCDGSVLTWGRGKSGQLGLGDFENRSQPELVRALRNIVICDVAAGWNHSGFVSDTGCLYTCGDGSYGQLGLCDNQSRNIPAEVSSFVSKKVLQVSLGMRHSLVLLENYMEMIGEMGLTMGEDSSADRTIGNLVYGFGSTRYRQLGINTKERRKCYNHPQLIPGLEGKQITYLCANGDQSAAMSSDGHVYTWGKGFSEKCTSSAPQCLFWPLKFSQLALGWNHALLLADNGTLFMLGGSRHGKLNEHQSETTDTGTCKNANLQEVILPHGKAVQISAGAEHSALVTDKGEVMTWGWGEHGQLGLGTTQDQPNPQFVKLENIQRPIGSSSLHVCCGSGFTFAMGLR